MSKSQNAWRCTRTTPCSGSVVYTVEINDMIYESSFYTVSAHRTKAGAVRSMQNIKTEKFMGEFWDTEQEWSAFRYGKLCIQE